MQSKEKTKRIAVVAIYAFFMLAILFLHQTTRDDINLWVRPWMQNIYENGITHLYDPQVPGAFSPVDYPPLYLMLSYLLSGWIASATHFTADGLFASVQLITGCILCWWVMKNTNNSILKTALVVLCPAVINNSFILIQSDIILFVEILFMIVCYKKKRVSWMTILFTCMCLTKLQGCYLLPVYLFMLWDLTKSAKPFAKQLSLGGGLGLLAWAPFMIQNRDVFLPFHIYLGGFSKYSMFSDNAAPNIWLNLTRVHIDFPYANVISLLLLAACIGLFILAYKLTGDITYATHIYLFMIFMITFNQRGRYEIYCLAPLLIMLLDKKKMNVFEFDSLLAVFAATNLYHMIGMVLPDANPIAGLVLTISVGCNICNIIFIIMAIIKNKKNA